MRIIGGEFKRRQIQFPKTKLTRPVTDRMKETIFNVLKTESEGARVLDLFAGSGSLGLEALSRGAEYATFVDIGSEPMHCIEANLKDLGLTKRAQHLKCSAEQALNKLEKEGEKFNLIFTDPPHNKGLTKSTLHLLDDSVTVLPLGFVVVGHSNKEPVPEHLKNLKLFKSIKIGQTFVSIFIRTVDCEQKEETSIISGQL